MPERDCGPPQTRKGRIKKKMEMLTVPGYTPGIERGLSLPTPTPEELVEVRKTLARMEYEKVVKNPPSRQALFSFLYDRAMAYLSQKADGVPRRERRIAARKLAKSVVAKVKLENSNAPV